MKKLLLIGIIILAVLLRIPKDSVVFTGSILGVISVVAIWFLVNSFSSGKKFMGFSLFSALFLAISPWHIFISKYPDKSLSLLLSILGIYIVFKYSKRHSLLISAVFFVVLIFLTNPVRDLLKGFSNTQVPVWLTDEQRREHGGFFNHPLVVLQHNKVINYTISFVDHYTQHFQGDFLFISGDVRGGFALMYFFDFIFIIAGVVSIIRNPKGWGIILILLILTPIPSVLDFQPPNTLKAYLMILPLIILSAFGASCIFKKIMNK